MTNHQIVVRGLLFVSLVLVAGCAQERSENKVFRPGVFGATSKSFSTMNKAELFEFVARTSKAVRALQARLDMRTGACVL